MNWIDWVIFIVPALLVVGIALYTQRYVKGVADFLAAGRAAGRYLVCNAEGQAGMGAITVVAIFEMFYNGGFSVGYWGAMQGPIWMLIAISGYIIYRYRETRALTMAQFYEMRYSRSFRIFMGIMTFVAGTLNYGIFPAVGARFFVYYLDLPAVTPLLGHQVPTFALLMAGLLTMSMLLVNLGGQLTALVTDAVESLVGGLFFIAIAVGVLLVVDWSEITSVLTAAPEGSGMSLLNPFDSGNVENFNIWFQVMMIGLAIYWYMAWQGNSGFNASAASPHEAKMGRILGQWRGFSRGVMLALLGVAALVVMKHSDFAQQASVVTERLSSLESEALKKQMTAPVAISVLLPNLYKGMFAAVMLFAVMACDSSYMHSWGSIFIQDVVLPIRQYMGRPQMTPQMHIWCLRFGIAFIAVFGFCFSMWFPQSDYIFMFMTLTGSLYLAGAGACIVGGLYWKRGTSAGAWSAMIVGAVLVVVGMVLQSRVKDFPLNGQHMGVIAAGVSILTYIVVSLITCRKPHNMDKLLHRGQYAVDEATGKPLPQVDKPPRNWKSLVGVDENFTWGDKCIAVGLFVWSMFWFVAWIVITVWNLIPGYQWPVSWWSNYTFATGIIMPFVLGIITTVWFTWGGLRDLKRLFAKLRTERVDVHDDGTVIRTEEDAELAHDGRAFEVIPVEEKSK